MYTNRRRYVPHQLYVNMIKTRTNLSYSKISNEKKDQNSNSKHLFQDFEYLIIYIYIFNFDLFIRPQLNFNQ